MCLEVSLPDQTPVRARCRRALVVVLVMVGGEAGDGLHTGTGESGMAYYGAPGAPERLPALRRSALVPIGLWLLEA